VKTTPNKRFNGLANALLPDTI